QPDAVDDDGAGVGPEQAENQLQHHRLSCAARPEQDFHAADGQLEAQVAQHDVVVVGEADAVEDDGELPGVRVGAARAGRLGDGRVHEVVDSGDVDPGRSRSYGR